MKSPIVTVARIRSELVRAGLYQTSRGLGATHIFEGPAAVIIDPALGLFNLAKARRVKIMAELMRRGYQCYEANDHSEGAIRVPFSQD